MESAELFRDLQDVAVINAMDGADEIKARIMLPYRAMNIKAHDL